MLAIPVTPELKTVRDWSSKRMVEAVEELQKIDRTPNLTSPHVDRVRSWLVSVMILNHAAKLCIAQLTVPPLDPPTLDDLQLTIDWMRREA